MTVVTVGTTTAEPDKVRLSKGGTHYRITYVETSGAARVVETKGSLRVSKSENIQRRDRVYPEGAKMASRKNSKKAVDGVEGTTSGDVGGTPRKNRIKGTKPSLRIDTRSSTSSWSKSDDDTPRTVASTPSSATPSGFRGKRDLRSPGVRKSPSVATQGSESAPVPDFITQTDRYGNAATPRTAAAVESARNGPEKNPYEVDVDPCETLLDSIRLMCCCLLPEESHAYHSKDKGDEQHTDGSDDPSHVCESNEDRVRLLPKIHPDDHGKKCLVLDLDETLVHSSFRAVPGADFVIPVQIEDVVHFVYVAKRPGVDEFLTEMAKHYEIVVYTASLNKYADPLLDLLDPNRVIRARLFRESCVYYEGNYVKDLSLLDRDLTQAIIVDNSPSSYIFHPENAIDCSSFIDDPEDRELDQIGAFLAGIKDVKDVRSVCSKWREWPEVDIDDDLLDSSQ